MAFSSRPQSGAWGAGAQPGAWGNDSPVAQTYGNPTPGLPSRFNQPAGFWNDAAGGSQSLGSFQAQDLANQPELAARSGWGGFSSRTQRMLPQVPRIRSMTDPDFALVIFSEL